MLKFKYIIIILLLLLLPLNIINASPSYSGIHMFNEIGNDNDIDKVEKLINNWFDLNDILYKSDLEYYEKLENEDSGKYLDKSYFEFDNPNETFGSWETKEPVMFYSLKAGNEYAMYWLEVPTQSGTFSTEEYLTNWKGKARELSHITFYTNNNVYESTQTPEPATLMLLGIGLIVLAGFYRKKYI